MSPKDSRGRERNYSKEYKRDHSSTPAKKARARRNASRAEAVKAGKVRKGDGKDVHHTKANARGKTQVRSRKWNRGEANKRR